MTVPACLAATLFGGASRFIFSATISSDTNNYNIKAAAIAAGWDEVIPLDATITRAAGVVIGSTSTGTPAFDTGSGFPATSTLALNTAQATGQIQGKGGDGVNGRAISNVSSPQAGTNGNAGGVALNASYAITIDNLNGSILGGGGSGASGASAGLNLGGDPSYTAYCNGGSGSGGGRGTTGGASSSGGTATGGNVDTNGNTGSAGTASANGTGGASAQQNNKGTGSDAYCRGAAGGNGGGAGSAGANSSSSTASIGTNSWGGTPYTAAGATGGAAGNAVTGNSNITWTNTGTRTGPIS